MSKLNVKYLIGVMLIIFFGNACKENRMRNSILYQDKVTEIINRLDSSSSNKRQKDFILDSLYNDVIKRGNDSIQRNLLVKLADQHFNSNEFEKYKTIVQKLLQHSKEKKDLPLIAKSYFYLGDYYDKVAILDSAFNCYNQGEKYYTELRDSLNIGRMKLYKADILLKAGIYSQSESGGIAALKILLTQNNPRLLYTNYNVIAISLKELREYGKALGYFNLALKQLEDKEYPKEEITLTKAVGFNNIARVYEKSKHYKRAIKFYKKGLSIKNLKSDFPEYYAVLLDNLGYSLIKSGDIPQAKSLLIRALNIRDSLNVPLGITSSKINMGEYFLAKGDTAIALRYATDGYRSAKKLNSSDHQLQALELLMNNDKNNKAYYTQHYIKIKDSLIHLERINKNKFARIAFETEEIEKENTILTRRIGYIGVAALILIGLSIFVIVIIRLKAKNKELLLLKEQQEANEKIYNLVIEQQTRSQAARTDERNRIAMELHDGIVNSVFTTRFNLKQLTLDQIDKKDQLVIELENLEQEIRRISHDLQNNLSFNDTDMSQMINGLIEAQQNKSHTVFKLTIDKFIDWSAINEKNKIHLYRIIQEAIQNVHKYAKAEKCFIFLLKTGNKTTLRIIDNGMGFNSDKVKEGIGLKNMRQRVEMINGDFKITSSPDNGTRIEIVF